MYEGFDTKKSNLYRVDGEGIDLQGYLDSSKFEFVGKEAKDLDIFFMFTNSEKLDIIQIYNRLSKNGCLILIDVPSVLNDPRFSIKHCEEHNGLYTLIAAKV